MRGPGGRRFWRLTVACVATAAAAPAIAQQQPAREVLLGVSRPGAAARAASTAPTEPAAARARDERAAQRLLDDARDDLAGGHAAAAQRLLELLIARHPDTAAAAHARHQIVGLYAGAVRPSAAIDDQRSTLGAGRTEAPPQPRTSSPPPAADGWRATIRAAAPSADEVFRASAGDRVFFGEGSADLGQKARGVLAAQAAWIGRHGIAGITIEGHADEPGSAADNTALAARRAEAVRRRLVEEGVPPERIAVVAYGREQPVAVCGEGVCSAQNRRAVTRVARAPATRNAAGHAATNAGSSLPDAPR